MSNLKLTCQSLLMCGCALLMLCGRSPIEAADDAQIQQAIGRGATWLESNITKESDPGVESLAALALVKAKVPANRAAVQTVVQKVLQRIQNGEYTASSHHVYQAGVEATLLVEVNPQQYQGQILAITNYIVGQQLPNGAWDYPTGREGVGDTSVTQYACLGLWAAERAGIKIPVTVWDNAMQWHITRQNTDGGFAYLPGTPGGNEKGASSINMTLAALGSLLICARHALPGRADSIAQLLDQQQERRQVEGPKFGVLEAVDLTEAPDVDTPADPTNSTIDIQQLKDCVQRAFNWTAGRIATTKGDSHYPVYFYYTLERMAALADVEQIGRINWFSDCADVLLGVQKPEGNWVITQFAVRDTAFVLLFLTRSTGAILKRTTPVDPLGGGLLAGGRGGLDDLSQVVASGGDIKQKKDLGPLDQLLAALENPSDLDLEAVQEQIIEKVQIGDRSTLIGQKDLLVRYVKHPNAEIRRTAIWALGRTDDLSLARLLIDALDDVDVGVMIEARNALCWLARKPNGLGEAPEPTANLPADATDEQRKAAVASWHAELVKKWGAWYLENRPYADRGDEFEAQLLQKIAAAG